LWCEQPKWSLCRDLCTSWTQALHRLKDMEVTDYWLSEFTQQVVVAVRAA
jgi:hypothetical protein